MFEQEYNNKVDIHTFDCMDLFNESMEFNEDDDDISFSASISFEDQDHREPISVMDVIQESLGLCQDEIFPSSSSSSSSLSSNPDDFEFFCKRNYSSGREEPSKIEAALIKLDECMKKSAETRNMVRIAVEGFKATTCKPTNQPITNSRPPQQKPKVHKASSTPEKKSIKKRGGKKSLNIRKKRKDFAVTGCLTSPDLIKSVMFPSVSITSGWKSSCYNNMAMMALGTTPTSFKENKNNGSISNFLKLRTTSNRVTC